MIQVKGLTRYYGSKCAVDSVSFEISRGEVFGLLGPNGELSVYDNMLVYGMLYGIREGGDVGSKTC